MSNQEKTEKSGSGISRVGILGLGLIGGSLAKALRIKAGVSFIAAMDTDLNSGRVALDEGIIDRFVLPEEGYSVFDGCDLVLLCTPLPIILDVLPKLKPLNIGILSDVGSVKEPVMEKVSLPNFIGGHPMAGSERHGYACSNASLFENAMYVLCVGDDSEVSAVKLKAFEELIRAIGAI
ncbi:MAG: prephenate dehydrogenase/arogenate dehydrogenase family protein, partial [Clostridiales bacterium]|nr:prephenate dehydrogenase/arogenate dehydrogenase family protein [Clostridiales bacterium]